MTSNKYRGYGVRPAITDPEYPLHKAWKNREFAPELVAALGKTPVDTFQGISSNGRLITGLYPIQETGHSTKEIRQRTLTLLALLNDAQKAEAQYPIDSPNMLSWFNGAEMPYGTRLRTMNGAQRQAVLNLVRASHSARGYDQVWGAMQLNGVLGDIVGDTDLLNTWNYAVAIFGTPTSDGPWGYQLHGHHVCITVFVLGDQIVTTPEFIGGEPVIVDDGPLAGLTILQDEERAGYDLLHALDAEQQSVAVEHTSMLAGNLPPGRHVRADLLMQAGATRDNAIIPYAGLAGADMTQAQRDKLSNLIEVYVSRLPLGHDRVRMQEVTRHLGTTHFSWIGGTTEDDACYYKIHSPVLLIEFDQHSGVVLDNDTPERFHTHTLMRTPNGNDYGKDLLRQHYEQSPHHNGHKHSHSHGPEHSHGHSHDHDHEKGTA
jgi:hypothetical protein